MAAQEPIDPRDQAVAVRAALEAGDTITVTDLDGEILAERTRPAPGTRYVGNGQPRGRRPKTPPVSPKS